MTPRDIIIAAMKKCGALARGQHINGEDFKDAFQELNMMLSDWATKRTMVFCTVTLGCNALGKTFYTVGPSGDFNIPQRPVRVISAYIRQITQGADGEGGDFNSDFNADFAGSLAEGPLVAETTVPGVLNPDYPLEILTSRQDYNIIATKGVMTLPSYLFYDPQWPYGHAYFWPIPPATTYQLFITVLFPFTQFAKQTLVVNFPPEYEQALVYNLAVRLGETYSLPPRPVVVQIAKNSLSTIHKASSRIARLKMPQALHRSGVYNPYSDTVR